MAYSFWNRSANREFKQQRRPRLLKRHLKNVIALLQTFSRLFHLIQFVKCWRIFLESNSKSLFKSSGKGKESRCLVFMSNTILGDPGADSGGEGKSKQEGKYGTKEK